jgi:hypothetical protein
MSKNKIKIGLGLELVPKDIRGRKLLVGQIF